MYSLYPDSIRPDPTFTCTEDKKKTYNCKILLRHSIEPEKRHDTSPFLFSHIYATGHIMFGQQIPDSDQAKTWIPDSDPAKTWIPDSDPAKTWIRNLTAQGV